MPLGYMGLYSITNGLTKMARPSKYYLIHSFGKPLALWAMVASLSLALGACGPSNAPGGRDFTYSQGQGSEGPPRGQKMPSAQEMAADMMERLTAKVSLSPEKQDKVGDILLAGAQERKRLFQQGRSTSRQDMEKAMAECEANTEKQLSEVLTDEEMAAYKEVIKEMNQQRPQGGPGGGMGGPGGGMRPGGGMSGL